MKTNVTKHPVIQIVALSLFFTNVSIGLCDDFGTVKSKLTETPDEYVRIWDAGVKQGHYDLAITNYYKYLASDSNDVFALEGCAAGFAAKQNMKQAIAFYSRAIQVAPSRPRNYLNRANACRYIGDFTNAISDFDKYIKLNPTNDLAYEGLGAAYLSQGDYERAIENFSEGLQLNSKDPAAVLGRANAFRLAHQYAPAVADYMQVMTNWPANPDGYNGCAWFRATCSSADQRDGKQAVELATKACNLSNWNDWRCVDTLAVAYAETGEFQKAIAFENQAILSSAISEPDQHALRSRINLFQHSQSYRE